MIRSDMNLADSITYFRIHNLMLRKFVSREYSPFFSGEHNQIPSQQIRQQLSWGVLYTHHKVRIGFPVVVFVSLNLNITACLSSPHDLTLKITQLASSIRNFTQRKETKPFSRSDCFYFLHTSHVMNRVVTRPPRFRSEQWRHWFFFLTSIREVDESVTPVGEFMSSIFYFLCSINGSKSSISASPPGQASLTFLFFSSDQCSFLRLNEDLSPQGVDWSWNLFLLFSHSSISMR